MQHELIITWIPLTLSNVKEVYEINIDFMEPSNQVRVDNLFRALGFMVFGAFIM